MMIMNHCGSIIITLFNTISQNTFFFKKDKLVPVEHGFLAAAFYMYFLLFIYYFSAKFMYPNIRRKKQQQHNNDAIAVSMLEKVVLFFLSYSLPLFSTSFFLPFNVFFSRLRFIIRIPEKYI